MNRDLTGALLRDVSRTFGLSIKVLPRPLREPVGLAYLLARASDTIADAAQLPAATRRQHLAAFGGMIEHGADAEKLRAMKSEIIPTDAGERRLIERAGECLLALESSAEADREDIREVLRTIIRGQTLDLERFDDSQKTAALVTAAELDEYTYLVAGSVGEFWTKICFRRIENYARQDPEEMKTLGRNFGMGLQLVNILRDLPADLRAGRCYLPADEIDAGEILQSPPKARPVVEKWIARAAQHLADAQRYIEAVHNRRVRFACILPWAIGVRTLALLRAHPPLETSQRVKVTRAEVRRILLRGAVYATLPLKLASWRDHLRS